MEFFTLRHKRMKSDLGKNGIAEDKYVTRNAPQTEDRRFESDKTKISLQEEIDQLQKQLEDQLLIRDELEKATISQPCLHVEASLSKSCKDLVKEISILEFEVKHLEKYLLSLYRKTFQNTEPSLFAAGLKPRSNSALEPQLASFISVAARASTDDPPTEYGPVLEDSNVNRSHSSLSYRTPPLYAAVNQAIDSYHSLPLGMLELGKDEYYSSVSLADHLGGCISGNPGMSANWLSEEMIKCISNIYGQIANPPLFNHDFHSSPLSFASPLSGSSPRDQFGMWSPHCEEFSGPYFSTIEVQGIYRNSQRPSNVEQKQRDFRSLVSLLEQVDPRKLKHEEKLAFWINIHNALVMHVFLVHGTPRGALKRISLVLKSAYNIGGHNISVGDIQNTILGCRLPHPGQWFQSLLFPIPKHKSRDARKAYAMKQPQPLAYFALCSGSYSDPMVRIYTPKSVFQELEVAKEEYIHNNFKLQKGQKMFLPKLVDLYAKDSGLCHVSLTDMIEHSAPICYQNSLKSIKKGKSLKKIEWIAHDFTFRYLLSPDLAK